MNEYELVVLLHPDLEIDLEKPLKKVEGVITENGGKVIKQDNWGKRKLAYQIKKQDYAVYVYYEVELPKEAVAKVERSLNITKEVIRYLITHPVPAAPESEDSERGKAKTEESEQKEEKTTAPKEDAGQADEKEAKETKDKETEEESSTEKE